MSTSTLVRQACLHTARQSRATFNPNPTTHIAGLEPHASRFEVRLKVTDNGSIVMAFSHHTLKLLIAPTPTPTTLSHATLTDHG